MTHIDNISDTTHRLEITAMVAHMTASYVSNHSVKTSDLPGLIRQIHQSLCKLEDSKTPNLSSPGVPAVPIEKSITPDYIICLEDGMKLKILKRHLRTCYGMTPEQYRTRWDLPYNYPMVAPNYSKTRRGIANSIGLGHIRKKAVA